MTRKKIFILLGSLVSITIFIRMVVGEPCRVSSPSMEPTILSGDWLWINKITYGGMLPQRWADIPLVNIFTWIPVLRKADEKNNWKQRRLPAIKKPRKGDIIVFRNIENKHELLVKRVVDIIPKGTTIRLDSSNYEMVRKIAGLERSGKMTHIYSVLNNYYFVVGDNRQNSHDSRSFGYIPESTIVGKINMALYSPLAKSQPDSSGIKRCRLFKWIQ